MNEAKAVPSVRPAAGECRALPRLTLLGLAALLLACACGAAIGATYYVDATVGHDSNSGISEALAWETIGKANEALQPGDTVLIKAGRYSEKIRPANSGTSGNARITYRAFGDGDVIIPEVDGRTFTLDAGAIALGGKSYVTVDGIKVLLPWDELSSTFGNLVGADHCIVENCVMEGAAGRGFIITDYLSESKLETNGPIETHHNIFRNNRMRGAAGGRGQAPRTSS
jgi:hypothetical protein